MRALGAVVAVAVALSLLSGCDRGPPQRAEHRSALAPLPGTAATAKTAQEAAGDAGVAAATSGDLAPVERASDGSHMAVSDERLRTAVRAAGRWLAAFDPNELRFDAAIGLHAIRAAIDSPPLQKAYRNAVAVARRDRDNPLLPLAGIDYAADKRATSTWAVPRAGEPRANVNRVVAEALHCRRNGLRRQTLAYLAGPMRDGGGYQTTHAAWALVLARQGACIDERRYADVAASLGDEIATALRAAPSPHTTVALDLMAERVLMLALLGRDRKTLLPAISYLVAEQRDDGSWGTRISAGAANSDTTEPPYFRYHATMLAAWALIAVLKEQPAVR